MPPDRSSVCKKRKERELLSNRIKQFGYVMPSDSSCSACSKHGRACVVLPRDSGRCAECVWRGFSCDAVARGVTESDWSALEKEEQRIRSEKKETLAKLLRLERQEEFLRERGMKMLRRGLKTLDELDEAEAREKVETERVDTEEATTESEPVPLDSDLTAAIESFDPLDPFWSNFQFPPVAEPSSHDWGASSEIPSAGPNN
jgi:hypothetical protein